MVSGVLFTLTACHSNTYDYFVVHRSIAHAVVGVQCIDGVGVNPHHPVRRLIRGDARRFDTRQMVRRKKIPAMLPYGPASRTRSCDNIDQTLASIQPNFQRVNTERRYATELETAKVVRACAARVL